MGPPAVSLRYKRTEPFGDSSDMLLKKSIASPENPSCDNGMGGSVLLCAPSLQWDGLWAGTIEQAQDRSWSLESDSRKCESAQCVQCPMWRTGGQRESIGTRTAIRKRKKPERLA